MLQIQPLDANVPIFRQFQADQSPVVLVNIFQVAGADIPALLKAWAEDAAWMKRQPGFISTQLHQGIAGSTVVMNYAVWESVSHFRAAFNHPEFRQSLEQYPASTVASPHLFSRLSVSNLCVGP
jgi:heme-degrading monooxygenase HmoA